MKKLFLGVLAIAGLVACVQEDVLGTQNLQNEIGFSGYVGKQVRSDADPSMTLNDLNHFHVWAYVASSDGNVLENEEVSKRGDAWTYSNTQYWVKGHNYRFFALANADENVTIPALDGDKLTLNKDPYNNGLGEITFTNNDGTQDVLYSSYEVFTNENHSETVAFNFDHILSKVKFTFKNGFATDNINLVVTDIKMTAPKTATTTLAVLPQGYAWDGHTDETTLAFGNAAGAALIAAGANGVSDKARLTIPAGADKEYTVTFKVEQYVGNVNLNAGAPVELTSTIKGVTFEAGKAYNFVATVTPESLDLKKIVFAEPTIDEWDTTFEGPVGEYVKTAAELEAKVNAATSDITVVLGDDITGDVMLVEKPGVHVTIDGNGNIYDGQMKIHANSTRNSGAVTIKNVKFQTSTPETNFVYAVDFGNAQRYSQNITVKDCTFEDLTTRSSEPTVVGVKVNATQNLVIKNCEAKNLHSLLQAQSCDADVLVEGVEIEGCKNGISFGNTARPILRNSTIVATEYGIRADGNASRGALVVENTTIEAKKPIVVRKVTTNGYKVTLGEGVALNTEAGYHVVFTKGSDDVAYVAPAKNAFTYSSVNQFNVFPLVQLIYSDEAETNVVEGIAIIDTEEITEGGTVNIVNTYGVTSANGLKWVTNQANANSQARTGEKVYQVSGSTIKLLADIDLSEENWDPIGDNHTDVAFTGVFDGQGHTIKDVHITGDHCFNGSVYGDKEGWGLFAVLDGATVKNLKVDGATFGSYTVISGVIAGYANNTTFENIDITNSKVAGYNWYTGGVVGWAAGECTFKNVNLDETVAVGTLWDSHGQNAGGIAGGVSSSAKITIEDCNIACVMDVINDVTSNYKWCVYRVAGMLIGNTNTTETKYNEVVTATATNVTCKNVTVTYGKWMNYHYCEGFWNRGWGRYESSDYVGGVDQDEPHNHADGEKHCECFPFDQLFGGSANGSGHYPVKGLAEFPGVTVVYPAEYTCPVCGQQHNVQ